MLTDTELEAEVHVLLVEDDLDDAALVEHVLRRSPHLVYYSHAANGREAIDFIEQRQNRRHLLPDLIILDLNMPVMNGQGFLKWLRARPRFDRLQVIVLTTTRDAAVLDEVMTLGANAALSKEMNEEDAMELRQMILDLWFHGRVQFLDQIGWAVEGRA